VRALGLLPLERAVRAGSAIGAIIGDLDRVNRPIGLKNLEIAFPEMPSSERASLLQRMYRNWGRVAAEWAHLRNVTPENVASHVQYEGYEFLERAREVSNGRGILVATGHFGNIELLPVAHAAYGNPIAIVHRPLRNPMMDIRIQVARSVFGNRVIPRKGAAREVLRLLRDNSMVAVPIDLDVRNGVFVDFFSKKACTTDGLVRLALASRAPIVPAFMVRDGESCRHKIKIFPHLVATNNGDRRGIVLECTQRVTNILEQMIRSWPDHWNWIHRRWKTRPPGEERFY